MTNSRRVIEGGGAKVHANHAIKVCVCVCVYLRVCVCYLRRSQTGWTDLQTVAPNRMC